MEMAGMLKNDPLLFLKCGWGSVESFSQEKRKFACYMVASGRLYVYI
jgi:hypothetical protein